MTKRSMHFRYLVAHLNVVAPLLFAPDATPWKDLVTHLQLHACPAKKICQVSTCCSRVMFLRERRRIREVLINEGQGREAGSRCSGSGFLSVLDAVCAGMSMRVLSCFFSCVIRVPLRMLQNDFASENLVRWVCCFGQRRPRKQERLNRERRDSERRRSELDR